MPPQDHPHPPPKTHTQSVTHALLQQNQYSFFLFFVFCFSLLGYCSSTHASSVTVGHIRCWPTQKAQQSGRLQVTWGSHCAGGRTCTKSVGVEVQLNGKWYSESLGYDTYPHKSKGIRSDAFGCWKHKKKYFSYTLKRWGKIQFRIELSPTLKTYKLRLYIKRKNPIQTQGWLKELRCKIYHRAVSFRRCPPNIP